MKLNSIQKPPTRLIPQLRYVIRLKHFSYQTEKSYVGWVKRYIFFHKLKHPKDMGADEISEFVTYLAVQRKVSPKAQKSGSECYYFSL